MASGVPEDGGGGGGGLVRREEPGGPVRLVPAAWFSQREEYGFENGGRESG